MALELLGRPLVLHGAPVDHGAILAVPGVAVNRALVNAKRFARLITDANEPSDRGRRRPSAPRRGADRAPPTPGGRSRPQPLDELDARVERPPRPADALGARRAWVRVLADRDARPRAPRGALAHRPRA